MADKTWKGASRPGPNNDKAKSIAAGRYKAKEADGLTKKEARFITGMLRRMDPVEAARNAGYDDPEVSAYAALGRPAVQEALKARAMRHVFGRLLPTALRTHDEIMSNESAPASARMSAVKAVYDLLALEGQTLKDEGARDTRTLSELSAGELKEMIDKGQAALTVIEGQAEDITPNNQPIDNP